MSKYWQAEALYGIQVDEMMTVNNVHEEYESFMKVYDEGVVNMSENVQIHSTKKSNLIPNKKTTLEAENKASKNSKMDIDKGHRIITIKKRMNT